MKEKMHEIKSKMMLIEWERKHSHIFSKDHIYNSFKEEYEKLEKALQSEIKKEKD